MSNAKNNGLNEEMDLCDKLNNNANIRKLLELFLDNKISKFELVDNQTKTDMSDGLFNIQIKKCKKQQFQQICRTSVNGLINKIDELKEISNELKGMCELPVNNGKCDNENNVIKLSNDNYSIENLKLFVDVLEECKEKLLEFVIYGNDIKHKPNVHIFSEYNGKKRTYLHIINTCDMYDYLIKQKISIRHKQTVVEFGNCLTFQRKGGDNGKKRANDIQFKIKAIKLKNEMIGYGYNILSIKIK